MANRKYQFGVFNNSIGLFYAFFCLINLLFIKKLSAQSNHYNKVSRSYYLSNNGNDSNDGSMKRPFKTINRINTIGSFYSDTISFKGGDYFTGTLKVRCIGSKRMKCYISSYGKGVAMIDGGEMEAILLSGSYFTVSNLKLYGKGRKDGNITNGLLISNSEHGKLENVLADSFQKAGISILKSQDIVVRRVISTNNGFAGIYLENCNNCKVFDSKADNNPGDPTNLTNHSGNGILVGMSNHVLIDHCTASNNGWDMPRKGNGPVGIWAYESNFITIQHCISYRNRTSTGSADGGGFDLDGGVKNSVIQYCLSYENEGSGYGLFQYSGASGWSNNIIRYCISINDAKKTKDAAGILVWNNSGDSSLLANCYVYNNIIYNDTEPDVSFLNESLNHNFLFFNNIFIGNKAIISGPSSGDHFINNIYFSFNGSKIGIRGYNDLSEWRKATGQEKYNSKQVGWYVNPKIKGPMNVNVTNPYQLKRMYGFKLLPNSPIKFKGVQFRDKGIRQPEYDFFYNRINIHRPVTPGIEQF